MAIRHLSTCIIHPQHQREHGLATPVLIKLFNLTPWDISLLSVRYIQKGLLFRMPCSSSSQTQHEEVDLHSLIQRLKTSLSHTLAHFSPLAGRLLFQSQTPASSHILIDCNDAGAEFIHAVADMTAVKDLLPSDHSSHPMLESFFPMTGAVSIDGISKPLLAVQLTELTDGFFLGCAFNHSVGDGNSFWHFLNSWAEMCRSCNISRPPILDRWFPSEIQPPILLPFSRPEEIVDRVRLPTLSDKFFHFSTQSIARLKAKANAECEIPANSSNISSFQALAAHMWRCITRARNVPACEITTCRFSIDNRARLEPPLSRDYFGNFVQGLEASAMAGDLASNGLGWAALRVHEIVAGHGDSAARSAYAAMARKPLIYALSSSGKADLTIGSSPRFDVYGVDFGWGSAVAVRTGWDNKFEGKATVFPGKEGGGTVDLELCISADVMSALEADEEFVAFATVCTEK